MSTDIGKEKLESDWRGAGVTNSLTLGTIQLPSINLLMT